MELNTKEELDRLEKDINTIKETGGIKDLPFGRNEIVSTYFLSAGGLYILGCCFYFIGQEIFWWGIAPVACVVISRELIVFFKYKKKNEFPSRKKEYKIGYLVAVVLSIFCIFHRMYSHELNIPYKYVGMSGLFFAGVILIVLALVDRKRTCFLGGGIPFILLGITFPILDFQKGIYIGAGILFVISGLLTGLIMKWQIKNQDFKNASN